MRTIVPLLLLSLLVGVPSSRAQVINGETPYEEDMLQGHAAASDSRAAGQPSADPPTLREPATAEPPPTNSDRD